jgi:hypothetical protein
MAPLIVPIAATLLARVVGRLGVNTLQHWPAATRIGLAVICFTASARVHISVDEVSEPLRVASSCL